MTAREFDPRRLDVAAFAKEAGELHGRWPLQQFDRVIDASSAPASGAPVTEELAWRVRGERRALRGGAEHQTWLHVSAVGEVPLQCQRCLRPVVVEVHIDRSFLFVHGEDAAAQIDNDIEEDVLPITRALDLRELVEDEVLLALPIVPRHDVCPHPLVVGVPDARVDDAPNPFAVLAALKPGGSPS